MPLMLVCKSDSDQPPDYVKYHVSLQIISPKGGFLGDKIKNT